MIAPRRERPVRLSLPNITTAEGVSGAVAAVLDAVALGDVTIGEGVQLANLLEVRRKAMETQEFERRLTAVEKGMK